MASDLSCLLKTCYFAFEKMYLTSTLTSLVLWSVLTSGRLLIRLRMTRYWPRPESSAYAGGFITSSQLSCKAAPIKSA
ncbi:hypothetical protein HPB48_016913 [Haemaphysalis longicornis]|uniref:Uncharacterized protein n=1 Tax=Haemaphysalis longicornis TaxID=44386 RepID=A0A9J6FSN2_HAELO|nr:hypothetical protein HPB48_016913 [Haemaphysalis longicornis]